MPKGGGRGILNIAKSIGNVYKGIYNGVSNLLAKKKGYTKLVDEFDDLSRPLGEKIKDALPANPTLIPGAVLGAVTTGVQKGLGVIGSGEDGTSISGKTGGVYVPDNPAPDPPVYDPEGDAIGEITENYGETRSSEVGVAAPGWGAWWRAHKEKHNSRSVRGRKVGKIQKLRNGKERKRKTVRAGVGNKYGAGLNRKQHKGVKTHNNPGQGRHACCRP